MGLSILLLLATPAGCASGCSTQLTFLPLTSLLSSFIVSADQVRNICTLLAKSCYWILETSLYSVPFSYLSLHIPLNMALIQAFVLLIVFSVTVSSLACSLQSFPITLQSILYPSATRVFFLFTIKILSCHFCTWEVLGTLPELTIRSRL